MTGRWRLAAWSAALAVGLRALHALGAGTLGVPVTSAADLSTWLDRTPPEVMALAVVRLAALATGWYLAVCTLALAFTRPFGRSRVAAAAARATPAVVRRVVSGGGGLGLAAGALLGALPSAGAAFTALAPRPAAATVVRSAQEPGPPTATMTRSARDGPTAVMTRSSTDDTENPPTAVMVRLPADGAASAPAPRAPPVPATADAARAPFTRSSWTVEAGDSFWSIAADTVAAAGREPTDRQVTAYWRRLVEANRSRLIDAGNPDLLVPGQHLVLPDEDG
jgi:nucleoid-associated protein YgaU